MMPLCSSQLQAVLRHSQQPGKKSINHIWVFPHQQKKPLLELTVRKGAKNWGTTEMIPAITSLVTDQKPEPFLAPRTHEVFRGWCSVEKRPGNQWLGGQASSLHTQRNWVFHHNRSLNPSPGTFPVLPPPWQKEEHYYLFLGGFNP